MEIEPMRWQNPVSRAAAAAIHVYPRAAAPTTAALKFHPKHEKRQKQNETHYENIIH
jgi:hypothetical protein